MTRDLARLYFSHYERLAATISGRNNSVMISPQKKRFRHIVSLVHTRHSYKSKKELSVDCNNVITDVNKQLRIKAESMHFAKIKPQHHGPTFQKPINA